MDSNLTCITKVVVLYLTMVWFTVSQDQPEMYNIRVLSSNCSRACDFYQLKICYPERSCFSFLKYESDCFEQNDGNQFLKSTSKNWTRFIMIGKKIRNIDIFWVLIFQKNSDKPELTACELRNTRKSHENGVIIHATDSNLFSFDIEMKRICPPKTTCIGEGCTSCVGIISTTTTMDVKSMSETGITDISLFSSMIGSITSTDSYTAMKTQGPHSSLSYRSDTKYTTTMGTISTVFSSITSTKPNILTNLNALENMTTVIHSAMHTVNGVTEISTFSGTPTTKIGIVNNTWAVTSATTTTINSSGNNHTLSNNYNGRLNSGGIVGIVVGCIVCLILGVMIFIAIVRWKKRKYSNKTQSINDCETKSDEVTIINEKDDVALLPDKEVNQCENEQTPITPNNATQEIKSMQIERVSATYSEPSTSNMHNQHGEVANNGSKIDNSENKDKKRKRKKKKRKKQRPADDVPNEVGNGGIQNTSQTENEAQHTNNSNGHRESTTNDQNDIIDERNQTAMINVTNDDAILSEVQPIKQQTDNRLGQTQTSNSGKLENNSEPSDKTPQHTADEPQSSSNGEVDVVRPSSEEYKNQKENTLPNSSMTSDNVQTEQDFETEIIPIQENTNSHDLRDANYMVSPRQEIEKLTKAFDKLRRQLGEHGDVRSSIKDEITNKLSTEISKLKDKMDDELQKVNDNFNQKLEILRLHDKIERLSNKFEQGIALLAMTDANTDEEVEYDDISPVNDETPRRLKKKKRRRKNVEISIIIET